MSNFNILRKLTKPMTIEQSLELARARYGDERENVSADDPLTMTHIEEMLRSSEAAREHDLARR